MQETGFLIENQRLLDDIKKFDIFAPFQDDELRNLMAMSKIRKYAPGETIFEQNTSDTWLYFLIYGQVRLVRNNQPLATLKRRGDLFGEMGAMTVTPRSASALAVGETVCLATDIFYIEQLTGSEKLAFGYVVYRIFAGVLADRLRTTTNALLELKDRSIKIW